MLLASLKLNSWSLAYEYMATMQSSCHSRWMQWWRRTNSKKLLLLLLWQALVSFSNYVLEMFAIHAYRSHFNSITFLFLVILSPFLVWLADAKFGRYRLVLFGCLMVFGSSVVFYLALLVSKDLLSLVFYSLAYVVSIFGTTCFSLAILLFLTDQFVGATSDELSAVVQWHAWSYRFGEVLSRVILMFMLFLTSETLALHYLLLFLPFLLLWSSSVTACVSSGWTGLIRSLTPSSSSYRYSTTLGSTDTLKDAVPSPLLMRNSPHEWIMARRNLEDLSLRKK